MSRLDDLVRDARVTGPTWNDERETRVFAGALEKKEGRSRRDRVARRALVAVSAASLLGLFFLRGASASYGGASHGVELSSAASAASPEAQLAVAGSLGDGGNAPD